MTHWIRLSFVSHLLFRSQNGAHIRIGKYDRSWTWAQHTHMNTRLWSIFNCLHSIMNQRFQTTTPIIIWNNHKMSSKATANFSPTQHQNWKKKHAAIRIIWVSFYRCIPGLHNRSNWLIHEREKTSRQLSPILFLIENVPHSVRKTFYKLQTQLITFGIDEWKVNETDTAAIKMV